MLLLIVFVFVENKQYKILGIEKQKDIDKVYVSTEF